VRLELSARYGSHSTRFRISRRRSRAAAEATIVAERHINRFGTSLSADSPRRSVAFDAAGIGANPVNFQNDFVVQWMTAFYDHAKVNALSADGLVHDPEQNAFARKDHRELRDGCPGV
jgi:hypothetical protein